MSKPFVKLIRSTDATDLIDQHPNAFLLLTVIALRARRTPNFIKGLDVCECFVGDHRNYGMSEQQYRTAKRTLEGIGLATFCPTNKGTVAKINNSDIYDINVNMGNEPVTDKQRASNGQGNSPITPNKNEKKEKNDKNAKNKHTYPENYPPSLISKFNDFIENRIALKKPVTEKAFNMLITKLNKLSGGNEFMAIEILDNSIINGWAGLFELKTNNQKPQQSNFDDLVDNSFNKLRSENGY
jgi:hypothetical protein